MFQFGRFPTVTYTLLFSVKVAWFFTMRVSPFGNPRIEAYVQLPAAYRSLSRPSSAPDAKAFTLCSLLLELPCVMSFVLDIVFLVKRQLDFSNYPFGF